MATFNISTAVNIDSLSVKAGDDTYNLLPGGYLTVDQDSRYGLNNNASAAMGNIAMNSGGISTVEFNATKVRLIRYNGGGGNVPVSNTTISQGSASGLLIGVYADLTSAPTASGGLMPGTGYIKIKQWNDIAFTSGALTGLTANSFGADVVGWIEIVGVDTRDATVNRLNTFKVRGEWYEIGTTDGNRATTYQIPNNGSAVVWIPGVWVETGTGTRVYEFYNYLACNTATAANIATDAVRGKVCWISQAGVLTFQNDGAGNTSGGYLPPSERKIRIPNIFFVCCTSAAKTVNVLPNATLTTRMSFVTTGGGVIDIDKCCMNWWMNFAQAYSVNQSYVATFTNITISEIAAPMIWSQIGIGLETPANAQFALTMSLCFAGGSFTDCKWVAATLAASGRYVVSITTIDGFTFTRCQQHAYATRGNATTGAASYTRVSNSVLNYCTFNGRLLLTTCNDMQINNTTYFDHHAATTTSTNPMYAFDISTKCFNIKIDGVDFGGLSLVQPYSGIMNLGAAGCANSKLFNLGTLASPLDLGGALVEDASWSRETTTCTVTSTAHGLKANDLIYVICSSNTGAITIASKTVLSAPTADTFTFTCVSSGSTSGTLSYYPTMSAYLWVAAASAAASGVEVKRCYCHHTRTGLYSSDNSTTGVVMENVMGDYINAPLATATPLLNSFFKGLFCTPALTAQVSTYGSHWWDAFITAPVSAVTAQSWSRVTTTATVTSARHNLRTGMVIIVTVSSSEAAIILGTKTVTAVTRDTFTFTCLSAGDASGTLTFVPVTGRIGLMMHEKTALSTDVYSITGTPSFTSAGGLFFPVAGDKVVWETPEYVIGHTAFPIWEMVMLLGARKNFKATYYIDKNDGNGYGSVRNLSYPRGGASGSGASTTISMTSTSGVEVNDYVFGTNVARLAKVVSIDNGTDITVDKANLGTISGILIFNHLPYEGSISALNGFKLKIGLEAVKGTSSATWTRSSTTATATLVGHGLTTGNIVYVSESSDTAAIIIGSKTVTVTNEDTFTFTCLSAGAASGTITMLYPAATGLYVGTDSSSTSRGYQYPLVTVPVTITVKDASSGALLSGARVYITAAAGGGTPEGTVVLHALTDVTGKAINPKFSLIGSTQQITGRVRKSTSSPLYKTAPISGEIDDEGFSTTVFMVGDE